MSDIVGQPANLLQVQWFGTNSLSGFLEPGQTFVAQTLMGVITALSLLPDPMIFDIGIDSVPFYGLGFTVEDLDVTPFQLTNMNLLITPDDEFYANYDAASASIAFYLTGTMYGSHVY